MAGRKGQRSGPQSPTAKADAAERMRRCNVDPVINARRMASWRVHLADPDFLARRGAAISAGWAKQTIRRGLPDDAEHRELYRRARRKRYSRDDAIQFAQAQASAQTAGGSLPPPPASGRADDDALRVANQSAGPAAPSFDGEPRR